MKQAGSFGHLCHLLLSCLQAGFWSCSMFLFLSLLMRKQLHFCPGQCMQLGLVGVTEIGKRLCVKRESSSCEWWPLWFRSSPCSQQVSTGRGAWLSQALNSSAVLNALRMLSSLPGLDL